MSSTVDATTLADLRARNEALQQQVGELKRQLEWFKRQLFGVRSERRWSGGEATLDLFGGELPAADEARSETITYRRRKSRDRGESVTGEGLRFDASVPVEVIEVAAPELAGSGAKEWEIIDYKTTHRLAQRPGSYVVLAYRRPVLRHREQGRVTVASVPVNVLEGSVADVSFLAGLLVDKFCYHQPLYRQHQRLGDAGIRLSRATLTNLTRRGIELLAPIAVAQHEHILGGAVVAMDETPIKAGRNAARGAMAQGWYWPIYGEADEISFTFSPHRATRHVHEQLAGFTGTLLSDGYSAYARFVEASGRVTHAQCWAHARRQFVEAEPYEPEAAGAALEYIRALYQHEAAVRDRKLAPDRVLRYRAEQEHPIVDAFFAWVYEQRQRPELLPKNPLARALAYVHKREGPLRVFLGDPAVPIDTNPLERALRAIPMGRKNWLSCWTELGARHVGVIQSLLTTCRLHGVHPYGYLVDVLQRVGEHPARDTVALTPRVWKERFAADPLRSDLHAH